MRFELPTAADLWRTDQLLASGLNSRAIAQLVQGAELVRLRRGTYARAEWWRGLNSTVRRRQLVFAHALGTLRTSPGHFVYSHVSGASLHDLQLWKVDDRVHLTQETSPSGISPPGWALTLASSGPGAPTSQAATEWSPCGGPSNWLTPAPSLLAKA